jgi:hypothetical protein
LEEIPELEYHRYFQNIRLHSLLYDEEAMLYP